MEFYKIWRGRGGTIGVHKMSLADMIKVEFMILILYIILMAVAVTILPTILMLFYILWIISGDGTDGHDGMAVPQRLWINVLTILSTVFFMLDFHFGLIAFKIFGGVIHAETYDALAIYNMSIGLVSVILFFLGHDVYKAGGSKLVRVGIILALVFFSYKFIKPMSTYMVKNMVTQCANDEDINKSRVDMLIEVEDNANYEQEFQDKLEHDREVEADRDERIRKQNEPNYFYQ